MEDFLARLIGGEDQRNQADAGGERGHEHGHEPFLGAADDHLLVEALALVLHEVQVVGDEHDAVSRGDSGHGDEADQGGDADVVRA